MQWNKLKVVLIYACALWYVTAIFTPVAANIQSLKEEVATLKSMVYHGLGDIGRIMEDVKVLIASQDEFTTELRRLGDETEETDETVSQVMTDLHVMMANLQGGNPSMFPGSPSTLTIPSAPYPRNCQDVFDSGRTTNGMYTVFIPKDDYISSNPTFVPVTVYCQLRDSTGWMVVLNRIDNSYFTTDKTWSDYEAGFGIPTKSHYLGNGHISHLTSAAPYKLRIELEDFERNTAWAEYSFFRVGPGDEGYTLYIDGYSGTAGNGLGGHNGMKFTTHDRDLDIWPNNCGSKFKGAWWYSNCHSSQLTGVYSDVGNITEYATGVSWKPWKGYYYSLKRAKMMIAPSV